jgi:hypothetical protein
MSEKARTIEVREIGRIVRVVALDSEFGARFEVECPRCGSAIGVDDAPLRPSTCGCGLEWRVFAVGVRDVK